MTTRKVFSIPEAAEFLRVSDKTVLKALKDGRLASSKIGTRRLITDGQIHAFLMSTQEGQR